MRKLSFLSVLFSAIFVAGCSGGGSPGSEPVQLTAAQQKAAVDNNPNISPDQKAKIDARVEQQDLTNQARRLNGPPPGYTIPGH